MIEAGLRQAPPLQELERRELEELEELLEYNADSKPSTVRSELAKIHWYSTLKPRSVVVLPMAIVLLVAIGATAVAESTTDLATASVAVRATIEGSATLLITFLAFLLTLFMRSRRTPAELPSLSS